MDLLFVLFAAQLTVIIALVSYDYFIGFNSK